MRLAIFTLSLLFGLSAVGQTFAVRISTNTALTQGDQVIWSGSAWVTYGKGTNGQVLTMDGTNVVWATPSGGGGGGSGTVTSVGASTTVSGLGFSGSPVTTSGTLSLTGTVAVASGGTGGTDAATARSNLGVLSSRWLTGFGSPSDYSEGIGTYYVNLDTYQVWEQTGVSTFETIPFFVMGEGVYSYLDQANIFSATNTFIGPVIAMGGVSGNGSSLTNLNGTEIRSGTVEEARIDSAIARTSTHLTEAEASALYQGTNSTLTRVAGIGAGTTGDLLYRDATGWTNLAKGTQGQYLAVTATVPAWSNVVASGTWDGTPIAGGTITNLTTTRINGVVPVQQEKGALFWDFVAAPPFMTALALSSGASFPTTGTTNDPFALIAQTGGSSANSGHGYYTGASSYNVAGGEEWEFGWYIHKTNNVGFRTGLLDVLSATAAATDGIYIEQQTNGTYRGVSVANASLSATASSYVPVEDSTIQYKGTWVVASNPTNVVFTIYTNGVSVWTDTVSANIPTNTARLTGLGFFSWHGGSGSGTNLIKYGWFSFKPTFNGSR